MFHILDSINQFKFKEDMLTKEKIQKEFETNPFAKYLIYEENNQVFGYIYYSEIYERIEINHFEVSISHRNCGIGSKLMKKFTETVDKGVTLEVSCKNELAINIYKKYGFKEKAIRKGYYQGIDGILMERKD